MVFYGMLCNIKTQEWKPVSEERAKKKEIAYFNNGKMQYFGMWELLFHFSSEQYYIEADPIL